MEGEDRKGELKEWEKRKGSGRGRKHRNGKGRVGHGGRMKEG